MQNNIEFKKVRDFGEVIGDTFLFIKQNFKPLLRTLVHFTGFFLLAGILGTMLAHMDMRREAWGNGYLDPSAYTKGKIIRSLTAILFSMITSVSICVSVLSYIDLYVQKNKTVPTREEIWAYFKYYYFRVLGSTMILGLMFLIAFLFFVIPAIYLFPAMSVVFPVMILENASFGKAFSRSFKLLRGHWWFAAGVLLISFLIVYAATMVTAVPNFFLSMLNAFSPKSRGGTNLTIILSSILQYVPQVFAIIPTIASALLYYSLVEKLEREGLLERIEKLGNKTDETLSPEHY